jgi:hypothetical protein
VLLGDPAAGWAPYAGAAAGGGAACGAQAETARSEIPTKYNRFIFSSLSSHEPGLNRFDPTFPGLPSDFNPEIARLDEFGNTKFALQTFKPIVDPARAASPVWSPILACSIPGKMPCFNAQLPPGPQN